MNRNRKLTREERLWRYDTIEHELWSISPIPLEMKYLKNEIKCNINRDEGGYYATLDENKNLIRSGITMKVYGKLQNMELWPNEKYYIIGIPYRKDNMRGIKKYKQNIKRIYNGQKIAYH